MKRWALWFIVVFSSFFLSLPSTLHAQRSGAGGRVVGGVIDVQVRYPDGKPAPSGIHIRLEAPEGGSAGDCMTIEGGKCVFNLSGSGVYMVRMSEHGYKDVEARVEIIGNSRGYASLELIPIPGDKPKTIPVDISTRSTGNDSNSVSALDLSVPENALLEFEKGQSSFEAHQVDESVSHFRAAIKLYDAFPHAHTMLGMAYVEQQDWKDAQAELEKALHYDPKFSDAYFELGAVFNQTKDYPKAEDALKHGLDLNPNAAGGHYELAKTYWAMGRWQEADPHATAAVTGMPTLAPAHVLMGNILLRKNDAQGALREYTEYMRLDPNGPMAPGTLKMIEKIQAALQKK